MRITPKPDDTFVVTAENDAERCLLQGCCDRYRYEHAILTFGGSSHIGGRPGTDSFSFSFKPAVRET